MVGFKFDDEVVDNSKGDESAQQKYTEDAILAKQLKERQEEGKAGVIRRKEHYEKDAERDIEDTMELLEDLRSGNVELGEFHEFSQIYAKELWDHLLPKGRTQAEIETQDAGKTLLTDWEAAMSAFVLLSIQHKDQGTLNSTWAWALNYLPPPGKSMDDWTSAEPGSTLLETFKAAQVPPSTEDAIDGKPAADGFSPLETLAVPGESRPAVSQLLGEFIGNAARRDGLYGLLFPPQLRKAMPKPKVRRLCAVKAFIDV
eukprot:TRINITY_DN67416_c10_g4_i2.p1 TRINITY_DN67416_c10_g4~~TRINITY_DN67416_c10_g4_i2.p1  ORF type:complete len:266 (-),score=22.49 TRINITY_DN67416_c10_g4_i2:611-1384(-)